MLASVITTKLSIHMVLFCFQPVPSLPFLFLGVSRSFGQISFVYNEISRLWVIERSGVRQYFEGGNRFGWILRVMGGFPFKKGFR